MGKQRYSYEYNFFLFFVVAALPENQHLPLVTEPPERKRRPERTELIARLHELHEKCKASEDRAMYDKHIKNTSKTYQII